VKQIPSFLKFKDASAFVGADVNVDSKRSQVFPSRSTGFLSPSASLPGRKPCGYSRAWNRPTASSIVLSRIGRGHMYHAIVRRIALQNFLRVNRKDYAAILKSCSPDIHHRFAGHQALGGERHDRDALGRWFERLGRLAHTLQLTVHDVWVKGGPWNTPWNTTVIMRWSAVQDLPDGSPYMRWGRVFDIDVNEDSQLVAASLQIWAVHGVNEALAAPILS
jgi:SnoaL-like domain